MPRLLLEIGCEELPASSCYEAEAQLPALVAHHLGAEPTKLFVGPRRIAFVVDELPERAADEVRRGPAERVAFDEDGRPTKAAEGFARGAGISVEELERRDGHVWARIPGEPLEDTLPERLQAIVRGFSFTKSMWWDDSGLRFPRPVRWLAAKLDERTVPGFSGRSQGHRFRSGEVELPDAGSYGEALRAVGVEPDREERRRRIVAGLDALGGWSDPAGVLDEVVHLAEDPQVLEASFDERFLALPERVIQAPMQKDQRYFPLGGTRFALVANGGEPDVVRAGNEQVLENRLDDATFTFERDLRVGIDGLAARLDRITFFEGAGTFADKANRLVELVERLGGGDASREAARLAKADQAAELVREFPDLEGYIGGEYARLAGYPEAVCAAVAEHYLPDAAGGPLPSTEAGRVLSAADKIDTLNVAFQLGARPTGSRDPYGLRRAAIGVCRLSLEGGLEIDRFGFFADEELRSFVEDRLESLVDVPVEFVRAARRSAVSDLGGAARLAGFLAALEDARLGTIHTVYTRATRIAGKAEPGEVRTDLLVEDAERALAEALAAAEPPIAEGVRAQEFERAAQAAESLGPPVERFFDDVLVMAEDRALRENRLRLLLAVRDAVGQLGDFAQIPR